MTVTDSGCDMAFTLETPRLYITRFNPASQRHCAFLVELMNCPSYIRDIGDRNVRTEDQAREVIETKQIPHFDKHGYGAFLVSRKLKSSQSQSGTLDDSEPIGSVSLFVRDGHSAPDIGFAFLDEAQGQGYATEASRALIDHALANWRVPHVLGFTLGDNLASMRALAKLGLRALGEWSLAAWPNDCTVIYAPPGIKDIGECGVVLAGKPATFLA